MSLSPGLSRSVRTVAAAVLVVASAAGHAAEGPPAPVTMSQAIDIAVRGGAQVRATGYGVTASEARVRGASAQRFPVLKIDANLQYWDKPLDVAFALPGMGGMGGPAMGMGTGGMGGAGAPAIRARDQLTWAASVTLTQPISALLVLSRLVALERTGVAVARADQAQARLDAAQRAAEAYLRVLQAKALETVAAKSLEQLEAQVARATTLEKGGALGHVDVLRLTAARENARQGVLRARHGNSVALSALAVALDLSPSTPIQIVDDLPDPPPALVWRDAEVAQAAVSDRPELAGARLRTEQARLGRSVALSRLLPNVLAVGTYQHAEGQVFQPKDSWFVGGVLSWEVWDWGKNWSAVKEAEAKAAQAAIGTEALEKQVLFDARRALLDAGTAYETIASARAALEAAEEAFRIQTVRYEQGAATTTDVIAGEADVSRARSGYAQARTDVYLAQAALARAVGRIPSARFATDSGGKQ